MHNPWKKLTEKKIYSNPWIELTEYDVLNPAGNKGIYGQVHFKNYAVGIIPLTENLETYLVGQYRFPLDEYSWEIPMGGGPLSDSIIDSAKRELQEETGLTAKNWKEIIKIHTSNSVCDETGFAFVATDLSVGESNPEETEDLQIKKLPFDDVYKMTLEGEITDCLSVASILKTKTLIDNHKLSWK